MTSDSLWAEMRRRKVFRTIAAYAAVGLGIIYAADTILPRLSLPDWSVTLVIVLVALGFPLAVGLAWAFDVTPAGVVRADGKAATSADAADAASAAPGRAEHATAGAQPVPGLAETAVELDGSTSGPADRRTQPAIVVLPFSDLSPGGDHEFFSDGLTEEIIADLAGVKALMVISRTSAMRLKNTSKDVRTIGSELGVRYVLEGSVRKAGDRLRITAQLIDAHSDAHLWAEKYDGSMEDVFDVQERVSREIVSALDVTLTAEEDDRLSERPVADAGAFELYLKARRRLRRYSTDGVAELLSRAIEIEGEAPALRALRGWALVNEVRMGVSRDARALDAAEREAETLLELAPGSGYGHALLGYVEYERGNLPASVAHFRAALAVEPNDPDSMFYMAIAYNAAGQSEAAYRVADRLFAADPLGLLSHLLRGVVPWFTGRPADATEPLRRALEIDPGNLILRWCFGYHDLLTGDTADAAVQARWLCENGPDLPYTHHLSSLLLAIDGEAEAALAELDRVEFSLLDAHHSFHMAESYAMAGARDRALDLVEHAVREGFYPVRFFEEYCPFLEPLRDSERFSDVLAVARKRVADFSEPPPP